MNRRLYNNNHLLGGTNDLRKQYVDFTEPFIETGIEILLRNNGG
ncbi:hypothetical protein [Nostoc sp.]